MKKCRRGVSLSLSCAVLTAIFMVPVWASGAEWPRTETDATGAVITLSTQPERIVSMIPSNTEILFALGLDTSIVGVTEYCDYPMAALKKPKIGNLMTFNVERILGTKPDLVLATRDNPAEVIKGLTELGITVFVLDPQTVGGVLEAIATIGRLTGREAQGDELINDLRNRINRVSQRVSSIPIEQRVSVFLGNPKYPSQWTPGPGSFTGNIFELAGGANIASDLPEGAWGVYSLENIVSKDPDVLLVTTDSNASRDELAKEILATAATMPGWRDLQAIRKKRVYGVTGNWISRPGPRVVLGIEEISRLLYPNRFPGE
jgi:iron complex transport system substrate-binding protein